MKVLVVAISILVKGLEELVTLKPVPLVILEIGVGIKVILINNVTHASKLFKILNIVLKDTPIVERPRSQHVPLVELVDTTSEQHVDDLTVGFKQIVLSD